MAHFWIPKMSDAGPCWAALPLAGSAYRFVEAEPFLRRADPQPARADSEMLVRINRDAAEQWFLVLPPEARFWVNGREPLLGSQILADRDEIRLVNGRRLYFSTERLPQVLLFPGADHEIFCARCRNPIVKGALAVVCPACGAWCHQTEDLPCWSYPGTTRCPLCDQSNDAEASFRWTPERL